MDGLNWSILLAAAGVGFVHTVLGPDHYVPFLMLAKAGGWSRLRAVTAAGVCGLAHVASSVLLGGIGVLLGIAVGQIERVEGGRGSLAAWALVAFGLAYGVWGVRRALGRSRGLEMHTHEGRVHIHSHGGRPHRHSQVASRPSAAFWAMLTVFILGPCEPLIPLFVLPASRGQWELAGLTALVFGIVTVGSMMLATWIGVAGLHKIPLGPLERWSHAIAGAIIAASGLSIITLGL
jgi:hypothetical protein